jgi:hypothetical protein
MIGRADGGFLNLPKNLTGLCAAPQLDAFEAEVPAQHREDVSRFVHGALEPLIGVGQGINPWSFNSFCCCSLCTKSQRP